MVVYPLVILPTLSQLAAGTSKYVVTSLCICKALAVIMVMDLPAPQPLHRLYSLQMPAG